MKKRSRKATVIALVIFLLFVSTIQVGPTTQATTKNTAVTLNTIGKQMIAPYHFIPAKKVLNELRIPQQVSRGEAESNHTTCTMIVTAYTDGIESTGKTPRDATYGQTAISTKEHPVYARKWRTIAASKNIPMGTKIYIPYFSNMPNHGIFIVEDRGGAIVESKLDVYFGDPEEDKGVVKSAQEFGIQRLSVTIMEDKKE